MRLFDIGAVILFFGALAQQTELQQAANLALSELAAQGYRIPGESDPVRVFPALTGDKFSGSHAGGWRPGTIYLRRAPQGGLSEAIYLRHELFHEVSFRTCGDRLPAWAQEAAAMQFSGELTSLTPGAWPNQTEIQHLKNRIRQGSELDGNDRAVLVRLVVNNGWPSEPCAMSAKLNDLLGTAFAEGGSRAYLLMSLLSGRILESSGDTTSRMPPGSLLKIPYAAALNQANPEVLGAELATSDTDKLLRRREYFQPNIYRLLLSAIPDQHLPISPVSPNPQDWRAYLGERTASGDFAVQAGLAELALMMRAALLLKPEYFRNLSQNGVLPNSTLAGQSQADKKLLHHMQVLAKTGTVSTAGGQPLVGHLLLAWPASHPVYLAIFRQRGVNGAAVLNQATKVLKKWQQEYPPRFASVRIGLLTPTNPASWAAQADCPELAGSLGRFSVCGEFHILSSAHGSRSERLVRGIMHAASDSRPAVLETDVDSYTDAVLNAEAQQLTGSAREAMKAVIAWNGSQGNHRHVDANALCDTTHCMVFLGELPQAKPSNGKLDRDLLQFLDKLANGVGLHWLAFANGGDQHWQRQIPIGELHKVFAETQIMDIRRERRKNGELLIRLIYPDNEEALPCEVFRNTLKLPSCPDSVHAIADQAWQFTGIGAGHGLGLSIARAQALAESGWTAEQILEDAYQAPSGRTDPTAEHEQ